MKHLLRHIPSLLLAMCFVVSGWLKGVDPYGTSLKLSEYFRVWGWNGFVADYPTFGNIAGINAFAQGARMVNANARIYLTWDTLREGGGLEELHEMGILYIDRRGRLAAHSGRNLDGAHNLALALEAGVPGLQRHQLLVGHEPGSGGRAVLPEPAHRHPPAGDGAAHRPPGRTTGPLLRHAHGPAGPGPLRGGQRPPAGGPDPLHELALPLCPGAHPRL